MEVLTGLKKKFEAILYCQRIGSPQLFQQLKENGFFILDVKKRLKSTRKRHHPHFAADLATIHPQSITDNKLVRTVLQKKDNLRSLPKKRDQIKKTDPLKKREERRKGD